MNLFLEIVRWLRAHPGIMSGILVFSALLCVVYAGIVAAAIARMSPDYFVARPHPEESWRGRHRVLRFLIRVLRELLDWDWSSRVSPCWCCLVRACSPSWWVSRCWSFLESEGWSDPSSATNPSTRPSTGSDERREERRSWYRVMRIICSKFFHHRGHREHRE